MSHTLDHPRWLYKFSGIHSFLFGLFPFFIPVFLWTQGYSLVSISLFISITALGYLATLWCWDRLHKKIHFQQLIKLSFLAQTLMLSSFFLIENTGFLILTSFLYGISNCFFWVTQRALFLEYADPSSSGEKFGSIQIFIFSIIQISIFTGAYLLETKGFSMIFLISLIISSITIIYFTINNKNPQLPESLINSPALNFKSISGFTDKHQSPFNFLIDGPFLFLESFYWTISLFLIANENFMNLGLLIILLAVSFAFSFYFIKNRIDKLPKQKIYSIGIALYCLGWILRAQVISMTNIYWIGAIILIISFCSSFFRLSYNKRFFDIAHHTSQHQYLFLKSYYSQASIFIVFGILSFIISYFPNDEAFLKVLYYSAALLSILYAVYRIPKTPVSASVRASKT